MYCKKFFIDLFLKNLYKVFCFFAPEKQYSGTVHFTLLKNECMCLQDK